MLLMTSMHGMPPHAQTQCLTTCNYCGRPLEARLSPWQIAIEHESMCHFSLFFAVPTCKLTCNVRRGVIGTMPELYVVGS